MHKVYCFGEAWLEISPREGDQTKVKKLQTFVLVHMLEMGLYADI